MKKIIPFLVFCLVATCNAELRTWTAVNGKEVEAEFVSNSDGQVTLKLKSGKVFEVPLDKLSELDQKFLKAKSSSGLLAENIVGRLITFESDNGLIQLLFNEDGVMMHGDGGDLKDRRLTYKIEGNEVLVFEEEERDGGISFSSSSPKVGDQVEMGPKRRIESAKITKIENAPQTAVNSSTEKQQKLNEEVKPEEPLAETKPELEGVNRDELEEREGIIYLKGSDTPYTGKFFVLRKNGQKEGEANFKDGKYDGLWVAWHKNGKKGAEKNFKDGKLISEKYWNDKGESVESERQALGTEEDKISELERENESSSNRYFELLTGPTKKLLADNISYEIEDSKATLTDFFYYDFLTEGAVRWAIPEKIDGHPVTVIGADSFDLDSAGASHVTIPNSVVRIEGGAFQLSSHLRSLLIGDGLTSMGLTVFFYSKSIESVAFLGDAPKVDPFVRPNPLFGESYNPTPTIFITPEAKGWGSTFEGAPVKVLTAKEANLLRKLIKTSTNIDNISPVNLSKKIKYSEVFSTLRKKNSSNKDNLEMVNRYLSNGGKINQRNQFGGTLLHVASANGYREIVKFLLSKGAKVNIKNNRGVTPLDLALNYKKPEVADMLRKKGAKTGSNLIENNP